MKYRALLFDWSGTLVDDLPPTLYATNAVLADYQVPAMGREEFRARFRLPYPEFYEEVVPGVAVADLEDGFRAAFRESPEGVTVLPHAREMLEWCRAQEIRCFVLSSMDVGIFTEQAHAFGLLGYFEAVYAGVIDKRDLIGEIMSTHGLDVSTTAFLGDMAHDIVTAQHGGIDSLALATGYDPVERLLKNNPSHLFDDLEKVRQWLDSSNSLPS